MDCDCKGFRNDQDKNTDLCVCGHDFIAHLQVVLGECSKPIDSGMYK